MLENFIQLVSEESIKSQQIEAEKQRVQKEKDKMFRIETTKSLGDFFAVISEARSVPQIMEAPKVSEEIEKMVKDAEANKEEDKKKTKEMQNEEVILREDNAERIDILKTFFNKLDDFEKTLEEKATASAGHIYADHMTNHLPKKKELNEIENIRREFNHFREMVSRQMSTIGGGGAVNLLDLDDIDTSSLGNGKFLVYNSTSGKLEFTDQVDGN